MGLYIRAACVGGGATAGSARSRSRDSSLENPLRCRIWACVSPSPTHTAGRLLLMSRPAPLRFPLSSQNATKNSCPLLLGQEFVAPSRQLRPPALPAHCGHSRIFVTTPEPTVRPPSRIAKRRPSSHAIGVIKVISMSMLSPGITISTPSGSLMLPVTSVVRK